MLISPRDDFQWQWECGECPETMRGYSTEGEAQAGAEAHWRDVHQEE